MKTILFSSSLFLVILLSCGQPLSAAAAPAWWSERGVLDTNTVSDYAPVLLGQLKWISTNAYDEVEARLCGGMGTNTLSFNPSLSVTDNWQVANVGQLKNAAYPFWYRLKTEGYTNDYPWTSTTNDDADCALANMGQMKNLFSFSITTDTDSDSLYDWWEIHWFGAVTNQTGTNDFDADSLNNSNEYYWAASPTNSDTDADGIADGTEVANRTDPNNSDTNRPAVTITFPANNYIRKITP